jgi:ssDNA-binding Zn-finger/Zn-ribbon topoisomerase 1
MVEDMYREALEYAKKKQEDTGRMIQKYGRFKGGYHGRRDIPESTGVCEEEA